MGRFSRVVLLKALFQIIGQSHVTLTIRAEQYFRVNEYDVSASAKQDGWGGIRTPGAFRHTRFPGVHNQPLCHPSRTIFLFL